MKHSLAILAVAASTILGSGAMAQDKIQIGDKMVFPESITTTSDGALYAGSFTTGAVFRAAPGDSTATQFIAPQTEGATGVIGVYADEATGLLWVCNSDPGAFSGQGKFPAVARSYSLSDGSAKASYPLGHGRFCNAFVSTADGTVCVADTSGGKVDVIKAGGTTADQCLADKALAGGDGISIGKDGAMYVNNVMTGKLYRIAINADGSAGALTEIATSSPLKGPDGMRFGDDGVLYLAENGAGQVDAITIDGDKADVKVIKGGFDTPTAVSKVGNTLWVGEAKFSKLGGKDDPGAFYAYAVPLQ
jgi:sugar lactone lactonase YvrE